MLVVAEAYPPGIPGKGSLLADINYPEDGISVSHQKPIPAAGGWVHWPSKRRPGWGITSTRYLEAYRQNLYSHECAWA